MRIELSFNLVLNFVFGWNLNKFELTYKAEVRFDLNANSILIKLLFRIFLILFILVWLLRAILP